MSQKYSGGFITKSPVAPTSSAASGIWTLDQQQQAKQAGNWPAPPNFIEEVFSTYLWTGTGAARTITNDIDLSTKGGLVWIKDRNNARSHSLYDTARGANICLLSNLTNANLTDTDALNSFTSTGFTLGAENRVNASTETYVGWTFREQPKFFDIVTWTGTGSNTTIAHNLGSVPGCIIVKRTDTTSDWAVYHRSLANTQYLVLNSSAAAATGATWWNSTTPTSSVFSVGTDATVNASGGTYVAYLFAHDSGGFGLTGTDNVISCGSFTTDGSGNATVSLGYEPQWLLFKNSSAGGYPWYIFDSMRGLTVGGTDRELLANSSDAEGTNNIASPSATGFSFGAGPASNTYIYIAIRRGPMKTPTVGTSVFSPVSTSGNVTSITAGFPVDLALGKEVKNSTGYGNYAIDRLRGGGALSETNTTGAEYTSQTFKFDSNTQFLQSSGGLFYGPSIYWLMRRAPGFFDEVCNTGNGSAQLLTHNLGVIPELIIRKSRSNSGPYWLVGLTYLSYANDEYLQLSTTGAVYVGGGSYWNSTAPTSSVFSVGSNSYSNGNGYTFVTYLFATCAGVSKVGSYTGTGTTQTINCGFTAGARFVLIKRTDSTGDWYVWDSARGIIAGDDPYLLLNSTAAEVTNTDYIDTANAGFEISSTAPAAINASAGTFIFLAIA